MVASTASLDSASERATPGASPSAPPRLRADAQRNRDALVDAARAAFLAGGHDERGQEASLEAIARRAGVGIGTLYRHFPTRSDLIAAVHAAGLDEVTALVAPLQEQFTPFEALRRWIEAYSEFSLTKRGMAEALREAAESGTVSKSGTRERVTAAVDQLLSAAKDAGEVRDDVRADDVAASLVGIFLTTRDAADRDQPARLIELVLAGIRA
ncbi:TetR/AcrR family transcriptional regulator [Schumannella soli]|uniref:TetR/AcrR family transcriptional regulator n=1 Tax=Schumannella soli TaxID=2590779 RepID=A0A506Y3T1_9MICO|nr:TetR/AcrR family transcriptional regulator [Schumannella soli]TPW76583.1 TetR/AcrR family transcriptional regulator [Schumannella soli]